VPANFNCLAQSYRWLEYAAFGLSLERCRFDLLGWLDNAQHVLTLGEGDGRFVAELIHRNPGVRVDCVEGSARMIDLARVRLPREAQVTFHHADARTWKFPQARYDAVVTCFFLDCFSDETLSRLIPSIAASIRPGGDWFVAEFRQPRKGIPSWRARFWLALMYYFFRRVTRMEARCLPKWEGILRDLGAVAGETMDRQRGLLRSRQWCWKGNGSQIQVK